jgi:hypothetical protein
MGSQIKKRKRLVYLPFGELSWMPGGFKPNCRECGAGRPGILGVLGDLCGKFLG